MTKAELYSQNKGKLRKIARDLRIVISKDYDEGEIASQICERIGEDEVAWKLLDQWRSRPPASNEGRTQTIPPRGQEGGREMRTTFKKVAHGRVSLTYFDADIEEPRTREFYVSGGIDRPGYVYESLPGQDRLRQVCVGLYHRGPTLTATKDGLPDVIRREWRRRRAAVARERQLKCP